VNERSSTGLFSRLVWGDEEVLLQSEITRSPEPRITTLILAAGEVLCRAEGDWREPGSDQVAEQQRVGAYHDRLLKALRNLRSLKQVPLREIQDVFQRIVNVALKLIASPAGEMFSALPGARWTMMVGADGSVSDIAPSGAPGEIWKESASRFIYLSERLIGLFGNGPLVDISMRIPSGYILVAPHWGGTLVAEVEPESLTAARMLLRGLLPGGQG
jgi:hypothetical protein